MLTIDGADQVCATQEYKFSFTLPEGATNPVYGYDFTTKGDGGIDAVGENNKWYGVVAAEWFDLKQSSFVVYAGATTEDGFYFSVEKTVALRSEHTDAEPKDHLCDICGATISGHSLEKIPAKAATVTETGNKEYWQCKDCEKYFSDADGKNEIADLEAWKAGAGRIDKLPPEIIDGKGQTVTEGEKKALSFRSNAAIADFIRVEVDSKPLYKDDYTLKEGSTIVTLTADYVSKLSAGEHTLSIVSAGGTASTTFTVHVKTAASNTVKAGDNSSLTLWFVLLAVSAAGVIGTGVYSQKKKRSAK